LEGGARNITSRDMEEEERVGQFLLQSSGRQHYPSTVLTDTFLTVRNL
jgi:hypothetical protein